jgi:anti-sigma-K factor RskA
MSDIHALSGAYAVDALDDDERVEFEAHLAACAECRAEVASLRETAALLAEAESEPPPASLRAGVLSGISQIRPLPPEAASLPQELESTTATTLPVVRRRRLPQLLAVAAAIILIAAGALTWHPWQRDHDTLADQILHAPDAMQVIERVPGGGKLTLVRSASIGRAVLVGDDVPAAGAGKTYQMWLQQPGEEMVSAGLMPDADEPTVLSGDAATAAAAAVSVEPAGGSTAPTTKPVAVFPLQSDGSGNEGT